MKHSPTPSPTRPASTPAPRACWSKRPAGFPCAITLQKGEKTADAKRIFAVMSLIAKKDETIIVSFDGEDEARRPRP